MCVGNAESEHPKSKSSTEYHIPRKAVCAQRPSPPLRLSFRARGPKSCRATSQLQATPHLFGLTNQNMQLDPAHIALYGTPPHRTKGIFSRKYSHYLHNVFAKGSVDHGVYGKARRGRHPSSSCLEICQQLQNHRCHPLQDLQRLIPRIPSQCLPHRRRS